MFKAKLKRNPLLVILFTIFIDLLGFGILIPVIPLLLADPTSPYFLLPKGMSFLQGYILLGFLTSIFPLMQFFATPILGQLSDKYGRKKILAISIFGTSVSYALFALGIILRNIPLLFIARAFDGITGGNISVAQAAIADITPPHNRARNFGLLGAIFGLGFIAGPFIGGKLSDPHVVSWFSATTPFWFAAILSFINVMSIIFVFPETLAQKNINIRLTWDKSIKNIIRAYSMDRLKTLFMTNFLFQGGLAFFFTFFSVYLIRKFSFHQSNIGDFFSYIGLWVAFTQAVITRKLSSRFREEKILRVTIIIAGLGVGLYFFPTVWWQLYLIVPFFAVANGLSQANMLALISKSVDATIQGETLGINSSVQALAHSIPPMLSGYIAAEIAPEAPILVSSMTIVAAGLVFLFFHKPRTKIHEVPQISNTS